jgi:hypothetical protein
MPREAYPQSMFPRPSSLHVPAPGAEPIPSSSLLRRRFAAARAAADTLAVAGSAMPAVVLGWLLWANIGLAAVGVAIGVFVFDDSALYFRELMPGTLLSAAHLLAAAFVASAIHRRDARGRRWFDSFWGLSAVLLTVLVVVELTQPTVFLGKWLQRDLGLRAPSGFVNIDALLVALLLVAVAAILAAHALDVLRYPRAVALFACAALLGATSQFIDSTVRASAWEFVVEDGIKALAGPFLLVGYLVVLHAVVRSNPPTE